MIQITINHEKFWNLVTILYMMGYCVAQVFIIKYVNYNPMGILTFEAMFNLAFCQFLPLGLALNRLNNEYNLRSKIFPFYFKFNDHTSIERRSLTEVS